MRKVAIGLVFLVAAGVVTAQEMNMVGSWTVYQVDELSNFTIRDYTEGRTVVPSEGTLVIADGGVVAAEGLNFTAWRMETGFFVLENVAGNNFFAIRPITPDVLFLTSLTVTERNREVTHIRMNRGNNLLVVRQ